MVEPGAEQPVALTSADASADLLPPPCVQTLGAGMQSEQLLHRHMHRRGCSIITAGPVLSPGVSTAIARDTAALR